MARKNIKVPEDLFMALRDDKDDEQSWPHYLETECLQSDGRDADMADRLDGMEMAIQELTDQVQSVERTLEDLGGRR